VRALHVSEARRPVLARNPGAVGREADGVIPASEHQQVKQLLLAEHPGQPVPQIIADVGGVVHMAVRLPRPGGPVRGSTTGRPLMAAMDLLGRRWALRILWELRGEPLGARALQTRCDRMSSSVLYERLEELTDAGLLARDAAGAYLLTDIGAALGPALESLDSWAIRWSDALQETDRSG
jgi:DNA-binding HxlR family transcriptional regulator